MNINEFHDKIALEEYNQNMIVVVTVLLLLSSSSSYGLEYLKLHTICNRTYHLDVLLIQVYLGSKFSPLLETVGLRVPVRYINTFLCSVPAPIMKIVLLDALQLLMLFVRTLTYLEPELIVLIIFYNYAF
jgi:hypothetical protein